MHDLDNQRLSLTFFFLGHSGRAFNFFFTKDIGLNGQHKQLLHNGGCNALSFSFKKTGLTITVYWRWEKEGQTHTPLMCCYWHTWQAGCKDSLLYDVQYMMMQHRPNFNFCEEKFKTPVTSLLQKEEQIWWKIKKLKRLLAYRKTELG